MPSLADTLKSIAEVNSLSLDVDYLGRRAHLVAYRRGGEVPYISAVHLSVIPQPLGVVGGTDCVNSQWV